MREFWTRLDSSRHGQFVGVAGGFVHSEVDEEGDEDGPYYHGGDGDEPAAAAPAGGGGGAVTLPGGAVTLLGGGRAGSSGVGLQLLGAAGVLPVLVLVGAGAVLL